MCAGLTVRLYWTMKGTAYIEGLILRMVEISDNFTCLLLDNVISGFDFTRIKSERF